MKRMTKFITLSVIAWCATVHASQDGSKVLVTMDGKPLITQQQLDQAPQPLLNRVFFSTDPEKIVPGEKVVTYLNSLLKEKDILEEMVRQEVINKYIHDKKMDTSPEYRQRLQEYIDSHTDALNFEYYAQAEPSAVEKPSENLDMFINRRKAANKYVHDNKIDTTPEYQQKLKQLIDSSKSKLNSRSFDVAIPTLLGTSDTEVQKFYNENKQDYLAPFEEIKDNLRWQLNYKNAKDKVDAEVERLKKEYKIVVIK